MVSCSGRSKKAQYEADKRMDRKEFDQLVAHSMRMPGVCFFCTDLIDGNLIKFPEKIDMFVK
jgi:hypothetical protein